MMHFDRVYTLYCIICTLQIIFVILSTLYTNST